MSGGLFPQIPVFVVAHMPEGAVSALVSAHVVVIQLMQMFSRFPGAPIGGVLLLATTGAVLVRFLHGFRPLDAYTQ
jgi:hypothetical protein